ncbi:predicted protein [Arabidopsis lyrata subsp. lyrata]|uniref:Predicted protein n=1 Tax=Arabidopsis lyrata subsp. lyrata TaxID=81972 RepID=D7L0Z1_ARALL|nr:predicted protein [Arabidopsis lyrata subsp. lyrata]
MENLESLLCLDSDSVRMIGVWGPSGIGVAQERLKDKKVLVILDDVNGLGQLDALARETGWFGPGSRIFITTHDLRLLKTHGINHIYKVMGSYFHGWSKREWKEALPRLKTHLDADIQSILRFSYDALDDKDKDLFLHISCLFNGEHNGQILEEILAKKFSDIRQRLRVLVEKSLISIHLIGMIEMHNLLVQLGKEIVRKQCLQESGQRQFLFDVKEICEGSKNVLGIDLNLLEIEEETNISEGAFSGMSNLQFVKPLKNLKFMNLSFSTNLKELHDLSTATSLKYLILCSCSTLVELPSSIGNAINIGTLDLSECTSLVKLPISIGNATNLERLVLAECSSLMELPSSIGNVINLQILDLGGCSSLVELPSSIGNIINLQKLDLSRCSKLVELPCSFCNANNLEEYQRCITQVEPPHSNWHATNLQEWILIVEKLSSLTENDFCLNMSNSYSSSPGDLLYAIGSAVCLKILDLSECSSLVKLPSSLRNAINLQVLRLQRCSSLVELPSSIGNAYFLQELNLGGCLSLVELPTSIGNIINLEKLNLGGCSSLVELPSSIGNIIDLKKLKFANCSSLVELPSSIGNACKGALS